MKNEQKIERSRTRFCTPFIGGLARVKKKKMCLPSADIIQRRALGKKKRPGKFSGACTGRKGSVKRGTKREENCCSGEPLPKKKTSKLVRPKEKNTGVIMRAAAAGGGRKAGNSTSGYSGGRGERRGVDRRASDAQLEGREEVQSGGVQGKVEGENGGRFAGITGTLQPTQNQGKSRKKSRRFMKTSQHTGETAWVVDHQASGRVPFRGQHGGMSRAASDGWREKIAGTQKEAINATNRD